MLDPRLKRENPNTCSKMVGIKLTEAEHDAFNRIAKNTGVTMSALGRFLLLKEISVADNGST